jgi:hypothetical protein
LKILLKIRDLLAGISKNSDFNPESDINPDRIDLVRTSSYLVLLAELDPDRV